MSFKNFKLATPKPATPRSPTEIVLGPAKNWSFSALQKFEQCAYFTKLKVVDKAPQPERDPNSPAARGERLHNAAEEYVRGETDHLPPELKNFVDHLNRLRELHLQGKVEMEEEWAYDLQLTPVDWKAKEAWLRLKLDVHVTLDKRTAVIIDYKSGKRFGNEVKHQQQGALYAAVSAMRLPDVEKFVVEFWYIDQNETTQTTYTRRQANMAWAKFRERALAMTTATKFPAKPSEPNCKFCDYSCNEMVSKQTGKVYFKGTGACEFDVYRRVS